MRQFHVRALAGGSAIVWAMASAVPADAQVSYKFNIPSQALAKSLRDVARRSGVNIVFDPRAVRARSAPALAGSFSTGAALDRLLAGTGLAARQTSGGSWVVATAPEAAPRPSARAEQEVPDKVQTVRAGSGEEVDPDEAVAEILVRGSRSINADIRRTENDVQPYVTFDAGEIRRSQATSVDDFLRNRLPMNTTQRSPTQGGLSRSSVNLRGLGEAQTLVLVDGRRVPSVGAGGINLQGDLNTIPLASIERIEVLPSTAGGIYGGGATGGVINIITRTDYTGLSLDAAHGSTFRGDTNDFRLSATGGVSLFGGHTRVTLSAGLTRQSALLTGERAFAVRARQLLFANNPAAFTSLATPPSGSTTNIRSANGSNLVLRNGTPLSAPITYVPAGYPGASTDAGAALVANAGRYNLELPADALGRLGNILPELRTYSATANVRQKLGDKVDLFVNLGWSSNGARAPGIAPPTTVTIPSNAATAMVNPFTSSILVRYPATGLVRSSTTEQEYLRGTIGLVYRLSPHWALGLDYTRSRLNERQGFGVPVGDPDLSGPGISFTTALQNGTLNPVRDLNLNPLAYAPYLLPYPSSRFEPTTDLDALTLRLSGTVARLPAGAATVSGQVEARFERQTAWNPTFNSTQFFPKSSQRVRSFYLETRVPLFGALNATRFIDELELQGSVRRDEYRTRSPSPATISGLTSPNDPLPPLNYFTNGVGATRFSAGMRWVPVRGAMLRASYGTGFLPPSIDQIVQLPGQQNTSNLIDPKRGGVLTSTGPYTLIAGGNPALGAEDSTSWSAGFVLTPHFLSGFRLSADYTVIRKKNEIFAPSASAGTLFALESFFPDRVQRDALTAADAALGYTGGVIRLLNTSLLNASRTRVEALDLQADYEFKVGASRFHIYGIATYQPTLKRQIVPSGPATNSVGFLDGPLVWRASGGASWERGPMRVDWNAQFFDSYTVYASSATAQTIANTVLGQGSSKIASQLYNDLLVSYRFGPATSSSGLRSLELSIGVQNIFDRRPPLVATTAPSAGYSFYGDPRLRRFTLALRTEF